MTMSLSPYLSFLQRPWAAIFLQTFWFNSELNRGIPKHSSRGTHSASVVASRKGQTTRFHQTNSQAASEHPRPQGPLPEGLAREGARKQGPSLPIAGGALWGCYRPRKWTRLSSNVQTFVRKCLSGKDTTWHVPDEENEPNTITNRQ